MTESELYLCLVWAPALTVTTCMSLWAACRYFSSFVCNDVMWGLQCLHSACRKIFIDAGVHLMLLTLTLKIEALTVSKTMAREPATTLHCKIPKTGSALVMNHSEPLKYNWLGQRLAALQSQVSPIHGSLYLIAILSILILSWHAHLDLPISL
jgi:hypothetical protein